jgi:hypothetical protein
MPTPIYHPNHDLRFDTTARPCCSSLGRQIWSPEPRSRANVWSLQQLATLPLVFVRRQRLTAMRSRTPRLATRTRLVLLMRLAAGSGLPLVPLAVAVSDVLLRKLRRRRLDQRLSPAATVPDTKTGGCGSAALVSCLGKPGLVVLVTLCLPSIGDFGSFDDSIDLSLLRRVKCIEVLGR